MAASSSGFRVIIVGGGPAGLAAGAQAARRGLSHVVLERGELAETIARYQRGKHVMDAPVSLPLRSEVLLPFGASSREEVLGAWKRASEKAGTNLRCGAEYEVVGIAPSGGGFSVRLKGGETLFGERVVLAIGLQGNPRRFGVPGDHLPHVTYQLDDPGEYSGKRIVVAGVGDAGLENALALAEQNEVAIANRGEEFDRAKAANRALVEAAIAAGRIKHVVRSRVKRFEPGSVVLDTPDGEICLQADLVIGRLGALPPKDFLKGLGVEFKSDDIAAAPVLSPTFEASSVPGLHLVGSLAGYPLIKHALNQGFEVIEHILGNAVEPADEPLLREKFTGLAGTVADVLARIQTTLPLFASLTTIQLREFLVESEVRALGVGETIFQRNDFSDDFYSILQGAVQIVAPAADSDTDTIYTPKSTAERRIELGAGDFFGEMSLISGRRRTATAIAGEDCVVISTPRMSMNKLIKSFPEVRRAVDEVFILRKLQTSLAPGLPTDELRDLARGAIVATFEQGAILFKEGDRSDGLHLIRRGSVTVSRQAAGRETVLAYLPAGNVVGEMALLSPALARTATVRAAIDTESIRLPIDAIAGFLASHPDLESHLRSLEGHRLVENAAQSNDRRAGDITSFLISAGAGEATDILLIDESLCVGCNNCESACAETHGGVSRLDREAGPTFASVHVPTSCRHCENPKCMTDCPPDALRRHPNGEVYILDNCIGCGNCAVNCPYGVIQMAAIDPAPRRSLFARLLLGERPQAPVKGDSAGDKKAVKCDLCRKVPGLEGKNHQTACVLSCPTGAIVRVSPKEYVEQLLPTP
jgi:CRP-like cAMP-binding protein/Fe-S-cluster-containing dehydrogenase component/thioredoxin reductase